MPTRELRNLASPIAANPDDPQRWKVVGLELAHRCTFCGAPSEATVGCPDETTPLIFQIGICNSCLVDCGRFREVKHARMVALAKDMTAAANAIREARTKAKSERYDRNFLRREPNLAAEAELDPGFRTIG